MKMHSLFHATDKCRYQSNTTQQILNTIISVQPKESGSGAGESREVVVVRQANDMLEKLPPSYDEFEVRERFVDE